jgi:hypothetical protein
MMTLSSVAHSVGQKIASLRTDRTSGASVESAERDFLLRNHIRIDPLKCLTGTLPLRSKPSPDLSSLNFRRLGEAIAERRRRFWMNWLHGMLER